MAEEYAGTLLKQLSSVTCGAWNEHNLAASAFSIGNARPKCAHMHSHQASSDVLLMHLVLAGEPVSYYH